MIGKTVKVSDINLIKFFYPNFRIVTEFSPFSDEKIIYAGPMRKGLKESLFGKTYISTAGPAELDLTNKEIFLEWLFLKKGKEVPASVKEAAKNYDEEYFIYCSKVFWITGKWIGSKEGDTTIYNLFMSSIDTFKNCMETYYVLADSLPPSVVESSFMTFLGRVKTIGEQNVSPGYMKLLRMADSRFGGSVKGSVFKMASRSTLKEDLLFLDLITDLR